MGSDYVSGMGCSSGVMKKFETRERWWSHKTINALNATDSHAKIVNCMLCKLHCTHHLVIIVIIMNFTYIFHVVVRFLRAGIMVTYFIHQHDPVPNTVLGMRKVLTTSLWSK